MKSNTIERKQTPKFESNLFNLNGNFVSPEVMIQNQAKPLTVLIIDGHRLFADGICTLLKEHRQDIDTKYLSEVPTTYEQLKTSDSPDLILLSINNNATEHSYKLIKEIQQQNLEIPVMILSATDSPSAAGLAIENNASGFISKNCKREDILEAILTVLDGNIYISKPKQQVSKEVQKVGTNKITKRQHQVLGLLSQGLLNKQIAWELEISENTVKAHLSDLFKHLHVTNRTAAVKYGYEYGLIM